MLSEARVRHFAIIWLNRENYQVLNLPPDIGKPRWPPSKRGAPPKAPQPPDIYAKRIGQNYYYYIEAKGDPASTMKLHTAIGQIQSCMGAASPARYGIAVPMSFCRIIAEHLTYEAWRNLGIYVLLVDDRGEVHELNASRENYGWIRDNV